MKKFLTVLLVIAVMFTFSFGSAFAALTTDQVSELKAFTTSQAANYYGAEGKIAKTAQSYLDKIVYDAYGYAFNMNEIKGYVTEPIVEAYMAKLVDNAEKSFAAKVALFNYADSYVDSKDDVLVNLEAAFATVMGEVSYALTENVNPGSNLSAGVQEDLLAEQLKLEKEAALAKIGAVNLLAYSDDLNEYKIVAKDADIAETGTSNVNVVSNFGLTANAEYTARDYVDAIVTSVTNTILDVSSVSDDGDADDEKAYFTTITGAVKKALIAINGHKITTAENFYVEAVPTIEDMKADTSLDTAKATAVKTLQATLASKYLADSKTLNDYLATFKKQAKPDAVAVAKVQAQIAALEEQYDKFEEVFAARINDAETTGEVTTALNSALNNGANMLGVSTYTDFNQDSATDYTSAEFQLKYYAKIADDVAALKAYAELVAQQKDVNGNPFYNADVLADTLEDCVSDLYADTTTLANAKADLTEGYEEALLQAKIDYIKFITGTKVFTPEDSQGYDVNTAWNEPTDLVTTGDNAALAGIGATVANTTFGDTDGAAKVASGDDLYDEAQAAALKALVDETKAAITAAATIEEIENIFAAAQDKYEEIDTVLDHHNEWEATGDLAKAYVAAKYDKELYAYATYFVAKMPANTYSTSVNEVHEILDAVAYPVVYEAYTVDELAAKVAEAKAAIDTIKTIAETRAEKLAVEAAIKALPAANAITAADKDAIVAAYDAYEAYQDIPGAVYTDITNYQVLEAAVNAYEAEAADDIDDAYKALAAKKAITTADEEAIKALRAAFKAHIAFVADYNGNTETVTPTDDNIKDLESALSTAKVAEVTAMMIKLPVNPTSAQKAEVEAARAAYEALTLAEKAQIVGSLPYDNLIDAEEALGLSAADETAAAIAAVEGLKITAKSSAKKGAITVKWTVEGDDANVDYYEVRRSTKANKGFGTKPYFTTEKMTYKNSKGLEAGTKYYYKVRAVAEIDGVVYTSDWSNKAYRTAK